jgi:hypothetical protein
MMAAVATTTGVGGFIAALCRCGIDAAENTSIVVFTVVAAGRSGPVTTQTGVAAAELEAWPAIPPHWVHFPATIKFASTNSNQDEVLPGWTRHSRQVNGWGDAEEPGQAWLAHLRRILQDAA